MYEKPHQPKTIIHAQHSEPFPRGLGMPPSSPSGLLEEVFLHYVEGDGVGEVSSA